MTSESIEMCKMLSWFCIFGGKNKKPVADWGPQNDPLLSQSQQKTKQWPNHGYFLGEIFISLMPTTWTPIYKDMSSWGVIQKFSSFCHDFCLSLLCNVSLEVELNKTRDENIGIMQSETHMFVWTCLISWILCDKRYPWISHISSLLHLSSVSISRDQILNKRDKSKHLILMMQ